jgi:hypothetical protein
MYEEMLVSPDAKLTRQFRIPLFYFIIIVIVIAIVEVNISFQRVEAFSMSWLRGGPN